MKAFIFAAALMAGFAASAERVCSTSSGGINFEQRGYDAERAVIQDCKYHPATRAYECDRNVNCFEASGPGRGPGRPGPGPGPSPRADIYQQLRYCQNRDLCTYDIIWHAPSNQGVMVTVEVVGEGRGQQLMSCVAGSYTQQVPWIAIGKRYLFRLYYTSQCNLGSTRYPANQVLDFVGGR